MPQTAICGSDIHGAQGQIAPALALDFIHPGELPMLTNIEVARDTVFHDWPGWGEESPGEILDVAWEPMKVRMRNGSCRWPTRVPPFFSLCPLRKELFWLGAPSPVPTVLPVPCTLIQLSPTPPWRCSKSFLHLDTPTSSYAPSCLGLILAKFGACGPGFDPVSALSPLDWSSLRTMTAFCHLCTPSAWYVSSP